MWSTTRILQSREFLCMGSQSLGGGEVTGGRGFGVVSGEAVRQQRDMQQQGMPQGIPADILQNIASGIQQQNNLPPGSQLPPQQPSQFPNQMSNQFPQQQPFVPQGQQMPQGMPVNTQQSDIPQQPRGPTLASGAVPSTNVESQLGKQLGGTTVTNNPTASSDGCNGESIGRSRASGQKRTSKSMAQHEPIECIQCSCKPWS